MALHGSILNDADLNPPLDFDAAPNPACHFSADPDRYPTSENDADPDPQHWLSGYLFYCTYSVPYTVCYLCVAGILLFDTHTFPTYTLIMSKYTGTYNTKST